jgi:hypothetical protein
MLVEENSWLIIVAPSLMKKVGSTLNKAMAVKKITKAIVTV